MEENWIHVAVVTGLWTLSIGLMALGTAEESLTTVAWSLLLGMLALVPTLWLIGKGVLRWERHLWIDGIADSIAGAVMDEARGLTRVK